LRVECALNIGSVWRSGGVAGNDGVDEAGCRGDVVDEDSAASACSTGSRVITDRTVRKAEAALHIENATARSASRVAADGGVDDVDGARAVVVNTAARIGGSVVIDRTVGNVHWSITEIKNAATKLSGVIADHISRNVKRRGVAIQNTAPIRSAAAVGNRQA